MRAISAVRSSLNCLLFLKSNRRSLRYRFFKELRKFFARHNAKAERNDSAPPPCETPHTFAGGHFTFHLLPETIAKMTKGGEVPPHN